MNIFNFFSKKSNQNNNGHFGVYFLDDIKWTSFDDVDKALKILELEHLTDTIKPLTKDGIRVTLENSSEGNNILGASRIGGKPDLPTDTKWPCTSDGKPLAFLAQLNCKELAKYYRKSALPQNGMLYFFYLTDGDATWIFDKNDHDKFKVIYIAELTNLQERDFPIDLDSRGRFNSCTLDFEYFISLPHLYHYSMDNVFNDEEAEDGYFECLEGGKSQVLGNPTQAQYTMMEYECELIANGYNLTKGYPEDSSATDKLKNNMSDWVLLFQLASEEKADMNWGDVGYLYFWIKKEDLAKGNFNNCWLTMQSY